MQSFEVCYRGSNPRGEASAVLPTVGNFALSEGDRSSTLQLAANFVGVLIASISRSAKPCRRVRLSPPTPQYMDRRKAVSGNRIRVLPHASNVMIGFRVSVPGPISARVPGHANPLVRALVSYAGQGGSKPPFATTLTMLDGNERRDCESRGFCSTRNVSTNHAGSYGHEMTAVGCSPNRGAFLLIRPAPSTSAHDARTRRW
jgi:hypothetical protein